MNYVVVAVGGDSIIDITVVNENELPKLSKVSDGIYMLAKKRFEIANVFNSCADYSLFERLVLVKCNSVQIVNYLYDIDRMNKYNDELPVGFTLEYLRNIAYLIGVLYRLDDINSELRDYHVFASPLGSKNVGIPASLVLGIYKAYMQTGMPKWLIGATTSSFDNMSDVLTDAQIKIMIKHLNQFDVYDKLRDCILSKY